MLESRQIGRRSPGGSQWLLQDVSLSIQPGERVAIVGPTGSGKTLLLRSLALLDPLDAGEIRWHGQLVSLSKIPRYRSQVAYLLQRPVLGAATVEESLRVPFGLRLHANKAFDRDRIIDQLAPLKRGREFLAQPTANLSGGEQQIVALLRTLQLQPEVLLLDEPTASMDALTTHAIENIVDEWLSAQPDSRALVWVTHDNEQVSRVTRRTINLQAGRIQEPVS